ncbi:MAG: TRAP transporter substrate-binding protein [Synergistaceae bacterium]|jgi:TRAP-type C4-dicarboxylate transport system substrate-binding protein|nr:TRAP transporter substrate-binding protein [Synergistaceae bacterium]
MKTEKRCITTAILFLALAILLLGYGTLGATASGAADVNNDVGSVTFKFAFVSSQALSDEAHGLIADEIERLSGGKMKVERYLQGQLYTDDNDGVIAVSEGSCEMLIMGDLMISGAVPEVAGFGQIPFAFNSPEHCERFWRTVADRCNEKMIEKQGVRILMDSLELRGPRMIVANKPILGPKDFKGVKFRLPGIAAAVAAFNALGVSPLTSSWSEVYQILQSGVAEACESPLSTFDSISVYEVAKYAMLTNHTYSFRAAHVNEKWWQSLSDAQHNIILQAVKTGFTLFNEKEAKGDSEIAKKWEQKGMKVYQNSEIDVEGIKNTVTPIILEKYKNEWDMTVWDIIQKTKDA